jgi:UDP-N-acetylglucosamine--N-acetylmuramyl-(pentapeptide) pyrophosphoryl-undecaprenol N-acetylglucosamine transferase
VKVAVTGGGTGGHTLPTLAVIKSLKRIEKDTKIFFVGSRFGIEAQLIPKMGIEYYGISTGKFRRYHKSKILNVIDPTTLFKNIADAFKFVIGIGQARNILSHERPDILFAKGGYVSLPVGIAAWTLKIPVVAHESDAVMGMANRQMSRFAKKICISFPKKLYPDMPQDRLEVTGNPIRDDIMMGDGIRFKSEIGFERNRKTLLVLGGSQGSVFINETMLSILYDILDQHQIIWIAGERDADFVSFKVKELPDKLKKFVKVYGFVTSEMADIYSACDLAVSRSGSNAIFELAALGKPAIFIPHDVSPGAHQFENARNFSRSGAAYVLNQSTLTPKKLLHQINYLLDNEEELTKMSEKMRALSDMGSADKVAQVIYGEGEKSIESSRETEK